MKLTETGLSQKNIWQNAGYTLPEYNRADMIARTRKNPFWIHFGAGNIFRAFPANIAQTLLNQKILNQGIIVAEGYDYEIIEKVNRPHDDYSILVTLKSNGSIEKTVIGSVAESHILDTENRPEFQRLQEIFSTSTLQMVSFTITEKGYQIHDSNGQLLPSVKADFSHTPAHPRSYIGKVASLLYTRYQNGAFPLAMVSMDNCSHNGDKLAEAICTFAKAWCENGLADSGFLDYVTTSGKVTFPLTMIDKITPRPAPFVEQQLKKDGLEDSAAIVTGKNTYTAPFVNAEECEYLVIEDLFPNGRPPLENGGVIFTDRRTVEKAEKMKVCTCLNPLHTALAVFGCLLGYQLISEEMKLPVLRKLVTDLGFQEGLPAVADPFILHPEDFLNTVLQTRIPNPFLPDTPQRIATDTSQKLAIRFGETINAYQQSDSLSVSSLKLIPLVFAGWLRYLMGIDDNGNPFALSPDPLLPTLCPILCSLSWNSQADTDAVEALLHPILADEKIFGVNLYEVSLAPKVCRYFSEMLKGPGAVLTTLEKYV